MCAALCCGSRLVCHRHREHTTDPLRSLPTYADTACSPGQMGDQSSHVPPSDDEQHVSSARPPHTSPCNTGRCDGAIPLLDSQEHGCPCRGRPGRDMGRAGVKRSARGEDVASTFPVPTTRSHLLVTTLALCSSRAHRCPGDGKPLRFSLQGRTRAHANPRVFLLAAFSRPLSRCDPCSFHPPLLHCFCTGVLASVAYLRIERQCTSKRQGKVRERQALW